MTFGIPVVGAPLLGSVPTNTVAPAIDPAAVIGTEITGDDGTWVPTPDSYTYQWQRYTGGAWAAIGSATNKNYTPVDADFGLALRLVVTASPGGLKSASNSTALTLEAPAQSLGDELLTNGNFSAWTGDNPDGWTVTGESDTDPELSEVGAGESHGGLGTGYANFYTTTTTSQPRASQTVVTSGSWYEYRCLINKVTSGKIAVLMGAAVAVSATAAGSRVIPIKAAATTVLVRNDGTNADVTLGTQSCKALTANTQLTAPSANMKLDLLYTLPASPLIGSQIWLLPRIADWSAGNNWRAVVEYTGSQWNVTLYSVASGTATSRIAAANIGASNGERVNMNGDQVSLWTTADGGTNWTQRGTTITNTTYQTDTGANALWTSDFTAGNLVFAAAA